MGPFECPFLFIGVPYCIGDLQGDPNVQNYPCARGGSNLHVGFSQRKIGVKLSGFIQRLSTPEDVDPEFFYLQVAYAEPDGVVTTHLPKPSYTATP